MPVRATVLPLAEPGHAVLRVTDLEAPADGLAISIQRQQGPDSHLADDGWRRTEAWLVPASVGRTRTGLEFELGPEICDRLAGIATVRLRIREPDIGVVATTVLAWPQMLTSGAIDPSSRRESDLVRLRRAERAARPVMPPPAPPFEPEPEPAPPPRPAPELRAVREPPPETSGAMGWLIAAAILIALCGGAYYAYVNDMQGVKGLVDQQIAKYFPPPEQPAAPAVASTEPTPTPTPTPTTPTPAEPPRKSVRQTVAEYLATKPAPDAMVAKGKEFAQGGNLNGAFLVWRQAAESGNADAELQVATFYDPLDAQPKDGFTPDGARAADWYERAALAGNVEAQRKYGLLLAKGGAGLSADPAKAKLWLQQAADQKDADARKALDALSNK
jgi:hypothetical protein